MRLRRKETFESYNLMTPSPVIALNRPKQHKIKPREILG